MEPDSAWEIADDVYFLFMGFLSPTERKKFITGYSDDTGKEIPGTLINTDKGSDLFYDLEDYFKNLS